MTDILLSIHPKWAELILSGEKTIEVRKTVPKELCEGERIFLYETAPVKKITGYVRFVGAYRICYDTDRDELKFSWRDPYRSKKFNLNTGSVNKDFRRTCLKEDEFIRYMRPRHAIEYAWGSGTESFTAVFLELSHPVRFETPRSLSSCGFETPPQSFQYVRDEMEFLMEDEVHV